MEQQGPAFIAPKTTPAKHPKEFVPMEHMHEEDELVYMVRQHELPTLRFTRALGGRKSLSFEGLLAGVFVEALTDSGATHSFASLNFLRSNGISYEPVSMSSANLADGSAIKIVGMTKKLELKIGCFRIKHAFIVIDMEAYDCVLGMSFFTQVNPVIDWRARTMRVDHNGGKLLLHAAVEDNLPVLDSERFELCTFDALSKRSMSADAREQAVLGCLVPECCTINVDATESPLFSGLGGTQPDIKPVLADFSDVLVTEIPGGLPPERYAADGTPIEHCVETAPGETPFARPPRPFTAHEDAEIQKYLKDLLSKGWITPSLSPWAAPVLFVPKKIDPVTGEKTWRMCISYVKLNSKTLNRIAYRLPRVADLLTRVSNASVFSKMDLLSGFYQVRMRASDIPKTGFVTPYGNFEFKVMPMGLCGAPSTFQYLMDSVFREPLQVGVATLSAESIIAIYLDDICVFSRTIDEHVLHLRAVLARLRKHKLYVKPTKCMWAQTEIEFLGHMVSAEGLAVHPERAQALQVWPEPTNLHELRSCLGTFNYWRQYISGFSHLVAPLVALTRKGVRWQWRAEVEGAALQALKRAVLSSPVLMSPDPAKPYHVVTDASDFAVGASLEQEVGGEGKRRPIAFFSHSMNAAERKYPTHERELLAIVLALRTWRTHLYGSEFAVHCQTDHKPLHHFMTQSTLSARQVRWQTFLSEYNLQVNYIPGPDNVFADGLSRRADLRLMAVGALGQVDGILKAICDGIKQDRLALRHYKAAQQGNKRSKQYKLLHGVLYYHSQGLFRVYVPAHGILRKSLLHQYHDVPAAGHFGVEKCYRALAQFYYWPGMRDDVAEYVRSCPACQRNKPTAALPVALHPLPVANRPFEWITLDWLSGFPMNKHEHDSVLNIIDKFSKWAIIVPVNKNMTTQMLCDVLWSKVFSWTGLPLKILGDRDSRLRAKQMRSLCSFLGSRLVNSAAYHPQTDGQTENFNRILITALRAYVNKYHSDWEECLPAILYSYHNTVHSATGFTPHQALFGWTPTDLRAPFQAHALQLSTACGKVDKWLKTRAAQLEEARVSLEYARQAMLRAHKKGLTSYDYKPGDQVKVSTEHLVPRAASTQRPKLQPRFVGPFEIIEQVNPGAYRLKLPASYIAVHDVFNEAQLRPWFEREGSRMLSDELPPVHAHPALNSVVQVLDRKKYGRAPKNCHVLDIPAQFLCVRKDGTTEWVAGKDLSEPEDKRLLREFEWRFPRSTKLPCESVRCYAVEKYSDEAAWLSDDELDLGLAQDLDLRYGR
jgi:transposase InsO family protein